jgi:magnesium-transporting ATPase (P-type)
MSVICKNQIDNVFRIFVKGSPEKICELCDPETIPKNFEEILEQYTKEGYRVIALANKAMPDYNYRKVMNASRDKVECNLAFLGLLIMENKLKS